MRRLRSPRWWLALSSLTALALAVAAAGLYAARGWSWLTIVAACLVPLAVFELIDAILAKVELHDDRIVIVRKLRKRTYARSELAVARWAKGTGAWLELVSGGIVKLPELELGGQGLVNVLRAWLRAA